MLLSVLSLLPGDPVSTEWLANDSGRQGQRKVHPHSIDHIFKICAQPFPLMVAPEQDHVRRAEAEAD
jgi:hypothetical protein